MVARDWQKNIKITIGNLGWVCNNFESLTRGKDSNEYKELVVELRRIHKDLIEMHQDLITEENGG